MRKPGTVQVIVQNVPPAVKAGFVKKLDQLNKQNDKKKKKGKKKFVSGEIIEFMKNY